MGNACESMADSFRCMTKPTTIKKKKKESLCLKYFRLKNKFGTGIVLRSLSGEISQDTGDQMLTNYSSLG